ncbi:hypothetical protein ACQEVZ_39400 [Dactylosporangium sp. CA-152071]|uniref:hypothetical protein n=1 Tax=Dactylosporangium sp. CA-152071 TaxID=3239933 RepID=UPI003D8D4D22
MTEEVRMGANTLLVPDAGAGTAGRRPVNLLAAVLIDRGDRLILDVHGQQMPVPGLRRRVERQPGSRHVFVEIGPEHLHDASVGVPPGVRASVLHGIVRAVRVEGAQRFLDVEVADSTRWQPAPELTVRADRRCTAKAGDPVMLAVDLRHLQVYPGAGDPL